MGGCANVPTTGSRGVASALEFWSCGIMPNLDPAFRHQSLQGVFKDALFTTTLLGTLSHENADFCGFGRIHQNLRECALERQLCVAPNKRRNGANAAFLIRCEGSL